MKLLKSDVRGPISRGVVQIIGCLGAVVVMAVFIVGPFVWGIAKFGVGGILVGLFTVLQFYIVYKILRWLLRVVIGR